MVNTFLKKVFGIGDEWEYPTSQSGTLANFINERLDLQRAERLRLTV